jgi:hypothetical protein
LWSLFAGEKTDLQQFHGKYWLGFKQSRVFHNIFDRKQPVKFFFDQ